MSARAVMPVPGRCAECGAEVLAGSDSHGKLTLLEYGRLRRYVATPYGLVLGDTYEPHDCPQARERITRAARDVLEVVPG